MRFSIACLLLATACGGESSRPFTLSFAAEAAGDPVGCTSTVTGLGPDGEHSVGASDLRFYVGNLSFQDAEGEPVATDLDPDAFQYVSAAGTVALIDLTGNTEGTCANTAIAFAEGTARTNDAVTGTVADVTIGGVSFEVGVPQAIMQEVIANNTVEGAPSPLAEMYWSWQTGYRHFVFNFTVTAPDSETGEGYVHLGSVDCGAEGELALENRDSCGLVYTPTVALADFDPEHDSVTVDIGALLAGVDFVSPIYDENFEPIGEGPGVECHSAPAFQPDCPALFANVGIDPDTGGSTSAANAVFAHHDHAD